MPSAFAAVLDGRVVNMDSQYAGCHGNNLYYYGGWDLNGIGWLGPVNNCQGPPKYKIKACAADGSWCYPTVPKDSLAWTQDGFIYDDWNGPRYGKETGDNTINSVNVYPFWNDNEGQNYPDGAVFDHWEYVSQSAENNIAHTATGTTLPANVIVWENLFNGVWFFYKPPTSNTNPSPNTNPTTLPTPGTPSCIFPASGATSVNSSSVIFDWGSATNAAYYYFRLDNLTTGQSNLVSTGPLTNLLYGPITLNPATNYQYRVIARNSSPGNSPGAYGPEVTCPFSTQPILGAQGKVPNTRDSAVTGNGISGLRALDDPNVPRNTGSNYANSLIITQSITGGNSSNTKLVGSAFTSKGSPPVNSSLYEMTRSAYSNNGFVLIYAVQAASTPYKTQNWWDNTQQFSPNHYYLYFNGGWVDLGTSPINPHQKCDEVNNCEAWIDPSTLTVPQSPAFDIRLYKNLGSRTWGTYGYLRDSSDTQTSTAY